MGDINERNTEKALAERRLAGRRILQHGEQEPFEKTGSQVGIDGGVKELAVLSNGTTYDNPRVLKNDLKKLAKLDCSGLEISTKVFSSTIFALNKSFNLN